MIRLLTPALITAVMVGACNAPAPDQPVHTPRLLELADAPVTPALLGPGFISTGHGERDATLTPDGSTFYYTLWTGRFGVILMTENQGDSWSEPSVVSFSGRYSDLEPFITADGQRLYFASNRPIENGGETKDYDIWYVERAGEAWGSPIRLDETINTPANEFYPSVDAAGNLYFTAAYEHSVGGEDIWMSRPTADGFGPAESVGPGVNTAKDEFNALIAPDGSFLAFSSFGREDGLGGGDLYISFRADDGQLGPGVNAGSAINSSSLDFSPALTPDGRVFLFSSRRSGISSPSVEAHTYTGLTDALSSPGNGDLDIYSVDAAFLAGLKNTPIEQ